MMLKPEQLAELRAHADKGNSFHHITMLTVLRHIDAQQARIAELESKWLAERNAYLQERNKCEQLEQDAARYRWLRDRHASKCESLLVRIAGKHRNGWSWESVTGDRMDSAIDAAMQK